MGGLAEALERTGGMRGALTPEDVRQLVKGDTDEERAMAAHKVLRRIERAPLTPDEREQAHEILRVMAADAAELVRRALAVTLKNSPNLPRDVALRLSRDVESICLPVLNFSPSFTDEDLSEIVRLGGPARQLAVAKRAELNERVTTALVEFGSEIAVETAVSNDNARFTDRSLHKCAEKFADQQEILAAMAYRAALPLSVSETLVTLVSDEVRQHLIDHHALSPDTAVALALGAQERATIDLVDAAGLTPDAPAFARHLHEKGRLSASLLLRVLAHGHMNFFEHALAELSGVAHHRTWLMVHDAGALGLKAIYERAGLPARLYPSFRSGVDAYHQLAAEGVDGDRERFQERMLQRFLTQPQAASREDLDYLLDRMDRLSRKVKPAQPRRRAAA